MNNSNFIQISPITKVKTITYTQIQINIISHIFGSNECEILVNVCDDNKEYNKQFSYLISGTDYLNWTTDNYIINWVMSKLKLENI